MPANTGTLTSSARGLTFDGFRDLMVAMVFISSFFVKVEPAITDFIGLLAVLLFFGSGLHVSRYFAAPFLFLFLYICAGIVSSMQVPSEGFSLSNDNPYQYFIGIVYTAITGMFLSAYLAARPLERYQWVEKAYWIGGFIGALLGLLVYYRIPPFAAINDIGDNSLGEYMYRVRGGYKDPNVFSTWLVLPVISMMQAMLVGRLRITILSLGSFITMLAALFFAFSRGAWTDCIGAAILVICLTCLLTPSPSQRARIIIFAIVGFALAALALVLILSEPSVRALFLDRFVLLKSYDTGETGRFGNQVNSIPMLLSLPLGFGPHQFNTIFGEDAHNTFLNSFASAGWAGGIFYILLFLTNCILALRTIFTRSPYQPYAIIVFSCYFMISLQGLQIDNEHWRHVYWMMGMIWGLAAATFEHKRRAAFTSGEIAEGWKIRLREPQDYDATPTWKQPPALALKK